jgi:uncharacterized protein
VVIGGALVALAAAPAAATVTLEPAQGTQGDAAEIAFTVTEDRAPGAYTKQIDIVMPDATPVAEVYPLSTDDWAPKMAYKDLATSLPGVHGQQSNSVVTSISWLRATPPAANLSTATSNELRVSLGPLPQADDLRFLVVQTYSDGLVKRWPNPVMQLVPPAGQAQATDPSQAAPGHGHGATLAGAPPATVERESGGHLGIVVGVLVALVIGVAIGGAVVASSRMRPAAAADEPAEPAGPDGPAEDAENKAEADNRA